MESKIGYSPLHTMRDEEFMGFGEERRVTRDAESDAYNNSLNKLRKNRMAVEFPSELRCAPWMSPATADIKSPNGKLHNELIEFASFMTPDAAAHAIREKVINE